MFVQNALCKKGLFAGQTIMISNDVYRQSRRMLLTAKYAVVREVYCQLRSIPLAGKHPNLLRIMPPVKCWRQRILSQKRPAAGGEARERASFYKEK